MLVGRDHQMAGSVGIQVQENKIQIAAVQNGVLGITIFRSFGAKQATRGGLGLGDVAIPPGTPENVHGERQVV